MTLMTVIVTLIVVGVLLWAVNAFVPMQGTMKRILNGFVIIAVVLWLLYEIGALDYLNQIKLG